MQDEQFLYQVMLRTLESRNEQPGLALEALPDASAALQSALVLGGDAVILRERAIELGTVCLRIAVENFKG